MRSLSPIIFAALLFLSIGSKAQSCNVWFNATPLSNGEIDFTTFYSASSSLFAQGASAEFYWQFDDGSNSSEMDPTHFYGATGVYNVCVDLFMMLDGQVACSTSFCSEIEVYSINYTCNASFTHNTEDQGYASFQNTSTETGDSASYQWNFGDNSFLSSEINPEHIFSASGNYEVCLTQNIYENGNIICSSTTCEIVYIDNFNIECPPGEFPVSVQLTTTEEVPFNDSMVYSFWNENQNSTFDVIGISGPATTYISQTCLADGCYNFQVDFSLMDDSYIGELTVSSPNMTSFTVIEYWGEIPWNSEVCFESTETECEAEIAITDVGNNCYIFSMPGWEDATSVLWDFGDGEIITGSNVVTHCYDEPGTYSVLSSFSYGSCEDILNQSVLTVEPIDSCNTLQLTFSSTYTDPVYWVIIDAEGNALIEDLTEGFSQENPDITETICLPDGCFTLIVEGMYIDDSLSFQISGIFNNEDISFVLIDNTNPNYYEFGINSDCNVVVEECEASFEPVFTLNNMFVEFDNTSVYDGNAQWTWDYGNGTNSYGTDGSVLFSEGGVFEVCLTVTTENCTDTHCEYVTAYGEGQCNGNIVVLTVNADYSGQITSEALLVNFNWNGELIGCNAMMIYDGTTTVHYCLPDGCFELDMEAVGELDIIADSVVITVETEFGETTLEWDELLELYSGEFGLDEDCFENVSEPEGSGILLYPNPSSGIVQIQFETPQVMKTFEVLDNTGRIVYMNNAPTKSIDLSSLSEGYYFVRISTQTGTSVTALQITR